MEGARSPPPSHRRGRCEDPHKAAGECPAPERRDRASARDLRGHNPTPDSGPRGERHHHGVLVLPELPAHRESREGLCPYLDGGERAGRDRAEGRRPQPGDRSVSRYWTPRSLVCDAVRGDRGAPGVPDRYLRIPGFGGVATQVVMTPVKGIPWAGV